LPERQTVLFFATFVCRLRTAEEHEARDENHPRKRVGRHSHCCLIFPKALHYEGPSRCPIANTFTCTVSAGSYGTARS
jgi:hypothetical protein